MGTIPIPKSVNKERMKQNINIFDFKLTSKEIEVIDTFNCNGRAIIGRELKDLPNYPFNIEY